tara:strand:- start:1114 stop:1404 length:291 start_codon:yes stop_codon:yes gene_type:complete
MNKKIAEEIGKILNKSQCLTFIISGYRMLETRLVMEFHDCKQVIDFKVTGERYDDFKIINTFYTKDHENHEARMVEMDAFGKIHDKEVPELKSSEA